MPIEEIPVVGESRTVFLHKIHGPRQLRDKPFEEALIRVRKDLPGLRAEQRELSGKMPAIGLVWL